MMFLLCLALACTLSEESHQDHEGEEAHHDDHADDRDEPKVILSPEAMEAARVQVEPATRSALSGDLSLPGRLALDPRKEAMVSAWISGQVENVSVRPGDVVEQGHVLAKVQSPELGEAVGAYRAAKAKDDAADARLERLKRLESDGVSSKAQVLEAEAQHTEVASMLEAAEERLRVLGVDPHVGDVHKGAHFPSRVPVKSPIAGKVLSTDASVGERVEPGKTLFHIGDLDVLWLLLDVYERDLASVQVGQEVAFAVDAWPDKIFKGKVEQVGDWVEPHARTIEVRVVVDNPEHRLKPNMFAKASLATGSTGEVGIVIPAAVLQEMDGGKVVFIEEEAGHFEARPVVIAEERWDRVRLSGGVEEGDRVVVDGAFALKGELEKGELGDGHAH